jgi:hypothetical protein
MDSYEHCKQARTHLEEGQGGLFRALVSRLEAVRDGRCGLPLRIKESQVSG